MPSPPLPEQDLDHVLTHAREAFLALRDARIFLTGGTGFFGHWLLESLLHADRALTLNVRVTVLTRNVAAFRTVSPHIASHPAITLLEGDIRTFAFPAEPHTHIVHAATDSGGQQAGRSPAELYNDILNGTQRVLDFAHQTDATRLLYVSTGAVYGRSTTLLHTPETFPIPALPPYSYEAAKRAAELLCINASSPHLGYPETLGSGLATPPLGYLEPSGSGLATPHLGYPEPSGSGLIGSQEEGALAPGFAPILARCFAFVGPRLPLDAHFAIGNFLSAAISNKPIHITGDGTPRRSWLYTADLAIWLWTLLTHGHPGRAYNVGSDEGMTIAQAAQLTQKTVTLTSANDLLSQSGDRIQIDGTPDPTAPLNSYVPDISLARNELDLRVLVPLHEALRRTAAWHQIK
jgi:dTDP-glucose 4,6-dehydratase